MSNNPKYLTVGQAAKALGLGGPWNLRRLERRGVIPAAPRARLSGNRYYSVEQVEEAAALLARRRMEGVAA